ncbi:MAG: hypothetical protein ABH807_01770, partial [Candidatus Shapirobacteria bacterium]
MNKNWGRLKEIVGKEPVFDGQLSLWGIDLKIKNLDQETIFFGTGLTTPKTITKGVPFDVLSMILGAELLKRQIKMKKVIHLIADTHAIS